MNLHLSLEEFRESYYNAVKKWGDSSVHDKHLNKWYLEYIADPKLYHDNYLDINDCSYDEWITQRKLSMLESAIETVGKD